MKQFVIGHNNRVTVLAAIAAAGTLAAALAFTTSSRAAAVETVTNLNDSGAGSLRQAVTDVDAGGTIRFASALSGTIALESEIAIDKSVTIDGNDQVAVSGRAQNQVFVLGETTPAIDVEMNDLEITRGYSSNTDGCGIHSEITGSLTLERMYFFRNIGSCDGAGVRQEGSGPVSVDESAFVRNSTEQGGGGIMIQGDADLTVTDSEFVLNAGDDDGGAIFTDGTAGAGTHNITDSLFDRNTGGADGDGGQIFHYSQAGGLNIKRSLFLLGAAIDDEGGAIGVDDIQDGSAVLLEDVESFGASSDEAGAMWFSGWDGDLTMRRVVVDSSAGGEDAGGFEINGGESINFLMEDSAIVNNLSGDTDAPVHLDAENSTYVIRNSTVAGNLGDGDEGGVTLGSTNGTLLLDGSSIVGNQVSSNSDGAGGLTVRDGAATVRNSIIADNLNGGYPNLSDCHIAGGTITLEGANIIENPGGCTFEAGSPAPITGDAGVAAEPIEVSTRSGGSTWVTRLKPNSPAIDAAVDSTLTRDQRGVPRPQLSAKDLGAYEWAPTPTVKIVSSTGNSMKVRVGCGTSIRGCSLKVTGSRNLKGRVSPAEASSVKIKLGAGQKKTVTISYTAKMIKFVRRGVRKNGQAKIAANAVNTATGYKGKTTAKTSG